MGHVLLALDSHRLYAIDDSELRRMVVLEGTGWSDPDFLAVLELDSGATWWMPCEALAPYMVPDEAVYSVLQSAAISGLRNIDSLATSGGSLPLHGNMQSPAWLSVNLGGSCDSRCSFCFTERIRKQAGLSNQDVEEILCRGRQAGVSEVVFTGGEPTLRRDLVELVHSARIFGYQRVGIQTNGYGLASASFLTALGNAGLNNALLSLHGPDAKTHDSVTRTPGSFVRSMMALTNLCRAHIDTTINFVVCQTNGPLAVDMVGVVQANAPGARLRFSSLIIEGAAHDNLSDVAVTLPDFVHWVSRAIVAATRAGIQVEVMNVPLCISATLGLLPEYSLVQRRSSLQAAPFYRSSTQRGELDVKLAACQGCQRGADCGGLQLAYLAFVPDAVRHVRPLLCTRG